MAKSEMKLPELLDIASFDGLHALLVEAMENKTCATIDASAVGRLTTPCAQLLVSFLQSVEEGSKIINPSDVFKSAWDDLGLAAHFPTEERA